MLYIDLIFCTNQDVKQNMVLMLPFSTNSVAISSMTKLIFMSMSTYMGGVFRQNMSVNHGIRVRQMFEILKNLLKTLIGEKVSDPFLYI